jgi:HEPN domain-containing protein
MELFRRSTRSGKSSESRLCKAWNGSVGAHIGNLPKGTGVPPALINDAKTLDKHYIPTRYPNGFDSGAPRDFYTKEEAERAIQCAEEILEFCHNQVG